MKIKHSSTNQKLREALLPLILMKVMVSIMFLILFSPFSSALDLDNVKSYDEDQKIVTVTNAFGFGDDIARVKLNTELVQRVGLGYQKVAEFEITSLGLYNDAFNKMEFYSVHDDNEKIERQFDYKYRTTEDYEVLTYKENCSAEANGTVCIQTESGKETKTRTVWKDLEDHNFAKDEVITIGIYTNVQPGDYVEWIPTFFGVEIDEWAVWTADLNTDLLSYYTFNATSGSNLIDDVASKNNGTTVGSPTWDIGLIGNSLNFDGATESVDFGYPSDFLMPTPSFSFWFNSTDSSAGQIMWRSRFNGWNIQLDSGTVRSEIDSVDLGASVTTSGSGFDDGTWHNYVLITNATHLQVYIDDVSIGVAAFEGGMEYSADQVAIGRDGSVGSGFYGGNVDELGVWNRTLTKAEITALYNGGVGITIGPGEVALDVTLNSPPDSLSTLDTLLFFSADFELLGGADLTNTTLNVWNPDTSVFGTNFTTITGTTNSTNLSVGSLTVQSGYLWNYLACGLNTTGGTICSEATSNRSFDIIPFDVDSQTFNTTAFETESSRFAINITTLTSVLSVSAVLNYNGTTFFADTSCDGFNCAISKTIDVLLVDGALESQNKSFFWNITTFDGSSSSTFTVATLQQNVSRIHIEQCDATYTTQALNFTAFDEGDSSRINPFYFAGDFEVWFGGGGVKRSNSFSNSSSTEFPLCISPTTQNYFTDATIEYSDVQNSTTYDTRNYFFQQDIINSTLQSIPLFLLDSDDSTSFILKVQDTNLLPIVDALIIIERFDPGTGTFSVVSIAKTDDNGQTVGFFKTETVDYRFIIKKNGVTLLETSQQKVVPETAPFTLTFTVGVDEGAPWEKFEDLSNLTSALLFNSTTGNVTFTYIDTSNLFTLSRLTLQRNNASGTNLIVCDVNSAQASATLTCATGNVTGTYTASAFITRGTDVFLVAQQLFSIDTFATIVGLLGVFLAWFVILISGFAFKFNEIAGIVLMNLTVIMVNLVGLVDFGFLFIFGMMGVSIMIMVLLKR